MRQPIDPEKLIVRPHFLWNTQWLLLCCGDYQTNQFNMMTVGWGSIGTMWRRPFAQVVVRPTRHTYQFMERFDTFTLCAFPEQYHTDLTLLGTRSGRNGNKLIQTGLTPTAARVVAAPVFAEAELAIECRKIYWDDFRPTHFGHPEIKKLYPLRDYHRIYFGEIIAASGTAQYIRDSL